MVTPQLEMGIGQGPGGSGLGRPNLGSGRAMNERPASLPEPNFAA